MKRLIAASLSLFLIAGMARAETWTVDKAQSRLGFTGSQSGAEFSGTFKAFDAKIDFDPKNPAAGHASVDIDMASAVTGDKQRDEAIPGADWFAIAKFPHAHFEAIGFKALGGDRYEADGTLSIRDVKKDVALPFTLTFANGVATADGDLVLVRTDYGVGQGDWSSGEYVGLHVDVTVHIVATPVAAASH
jgi:polyisoprenoid-binding protein YceI